MTFQIQAVTVYGKQPGQVRTVPFHTGTLNIVTGDSRRGKSALLTIIDYCLASSAYPVKAGKVRNYVGAYAVTLAKPGQQPDHRSVDLPGAERGRQPRPALPLSR